MKASDGKKNPPSWLQARLTLSLTAIQEKIARIFLSVACELWLRGQIAMAEDVLQVARTLTIRLAEKPAQSLCSLMRLANPWRLLKLNACYMPRIGSGPSCLNWSAQPERESSEVNRDRAPVAQQKCWSPIAPTVARTVSWTSQVVHLPSWHGFLPAGQAKLLLDLWQMLVTMRRNRKRSISHV